MPRTSRLLSKARLFTSQAISDDDLSKMLFCITNEVETLTDASGIIIKKEYDVPDVKVRTHFRILGVALADGLNQLALRETCR